MASSTTIAQIRTAVAAKIDDAGGFNQVSAYPLSNPSPPCAQVMGLDSVDYDQAMQRGLDRMTMVVQAFAGTPDDQAAHEVVEQWMAMSGANSIKQVLEATNSTLGGLVAGCRVARASGQRIYNLPHKGETLGVEFFLDIWL